MSLEDVGRDAGADLAKKTPDSTYTAAEVEWAVRNAKLTTVELRRCSICHAPLRFLLGASDPLFDGSCDCGSVRWPPRRHSWQDIADLINMQPTPEGRASMAAKFGFPAETSGAADSAPPQPRDKAP